MVDSVHVSQDDVLYFAYKNVTANRLIIVGKPIRTVGSSDVLIYHEHPFDGV